MPRAEANTPKAIANKIKSIGLQKLKWYCQLCQKQCRDDNGFKCHQMSESHLRLMKVFAENPNRFLDDYSIQFEKSFLQVLSHRHNTKKVEINKVYQEYIADKNHIHMNATCWTSLTSLCIYLGKEGKCVVEETEKGWFIQWIDRDPKTIARQAMLNVKEKQELDDEERNRLVIESQIQAAELKMKQQAGFEVGDKDVDDKGAYLIRDSSDKIEISLIDSAPKKRPKLLTLNDIYTDIYDNSSNNVNNDKKAAAASNTSSSIPNSSKDAITLHIEEVEAAKATMLANDEKKNRNDYWLHTNIIVKVLNKHVANGIYYKEKGVVVAVIDRYVGEVRMHDNTILRLDQEHLQTVVPKVDTQVLIVNGRCRGCKAKLVKINESSYNCEVMVEEGFYANRILYNVEYEDVCMCAV